MDHRAFLADLLERSPRGTKAWICRHLDVNQTELANWIRGRNRSLSNVKVWVVCDFIRELEEGLVKLPTEADLGIYRARKRRQSFRDRLTPELTTDMLEVILDEMEAFQYDDAEPEESRLKVLAWARGELNRQLGRYQK